MKIEEFEELYHRLRNPVVSYFRKRDVRYHDAFDLADEVFFNAYRHYEGFHAQFEEAPEGWIWKIAHNEYINWVRDLKHASVRIPVNYGIPDSSGVVLDSLEIDEIRRTIGDNDFKMLSMIAEGYKSTEIAKIIGITPNQTRTRIHRVRKRLRGRR